ncbi:MAG: hypothetical protein MJ109_07170 [Kiritimatiellae bacterium]|nr:hypothetical protein [Kiritimatiellia bacterium]
MNTFETVNSAYALHECLNEQEAKQRIENEKAMRERANVESLSRLVEELTRQNEFLKAQAKSDKKWKWVTTIIAIIGTIGSIFGIIF